MPGFFLRVFFCPFGFIGGVVEIFLLPHIALHDLNTILWVTCGCGVGSVWGVCGFFKSSGRGTSEQDPNKTRTRPKKKG